MTAASRMRYGGLVGAACALALLTAAPAGAQTAGPGLQGEYFDTLNGPSTMTTDSRVCNPSGVSSIAFHATGVATGPYTGTFTEDGTVSFGPQTIQLGIGNFFGYMEDFDARFTIDSPAGDVVGVKHYPEDAQPSLSAIGTCRPAPSPSFNDFFQAFARAIEYEAVIRTANGAMYRDHGTADTYVENQDTADESYSFRRLSQVFTSTGTEPIVLTKDDCKHGDPIFESKKACKDFVKGKEK